MTALVWFAGIFVGYRVLRIVARILLGPIAKQWRERPVIIWDDYDNRWRAADRLRGR